MWRKYGSLHTLPSYSLFTRTPIEVLPTSFSHAAKSFRYFRLLKLFVSIPHNSHFSKHSSLGLWHTHFPVFCLLNWPFLLSLFFSFFFLEDFYLEISIFLSFSHSIFFISVLYVYHVVSPIFMTLNSTYTSRHKVRSHMHIPWSELSAACHTIKLKFQASLG